MAKYKKIPSEIQKWSYFPYFISRFFPNSKTYSIYVLENDEDLKSFSEWWKVKTITHNRKFKGSNPDEVDDFLFDAVNNVVISIPNIFETKTTAQINKLVIAETLRLYTEKYWVQEEWMENLSFNEDDEWLNLDDTDFDFVESDLSEEIETDDLMTEEEMIWNMTQEEYEEHISNRKDRMAEEIVREWVSKEQIEKKKEEFMEEIDALEVLLQERDARIREFENKNKMLQDAEKWDFTILWKEFEGLSYEEAKAKEIQQRRERLEAQMKEEQEMIEKMNNKEWIENYSAWLDEFGLLEKRELLDWKFSLTWKLNAKEILWKEYGMVEYELLKVMRSLEEDDFFLNLELFEIWKVEQSFLNNILNDINKENGLMKAIVKESFNDNQVFTKHVEFKLAGHWNYLIEIIEQPFWMLKMKWTFKLKSEAGRNYISIEKSMAVSNRLKGYYKRNLQEIKLLDQWDDIRGIERESSVRSKRKQNNSWYKITNVTRRVWWFAWRTAMGILKTPLKFAKWFKGYMNR